MNGRFVAAAAAALWVAAPAAAQKRVNQRIAASGSGPVEISNTAGSVSVSAWDRDEVEVTGTLGRGTERLQLANEAGRTVVRVVLPSWGRSEGSDIQVRVPARRDLVVRTVSADATVSGATSFVDVRTVSGEVRVDGQPREVAASSRSGSVTVSATTGRVKAESVSGEVRVSGDVRDRVEASTVSGELTVEARTPEAHVETVSGDVTLGALSGRAEVSTVSGDVRLAGRRIQADVRSVSGDVSIEGDLDAQTATQINTHSGDVHLRLARGTGAELDFNSFSGDVSGDVPGGMRMTHASGHEQHLVVGRGGARVVVHTFSGDLDIEEG
jgi:DUF4097 and DUF4098 domain-containing protein YvlB